jgi:two-component system, cell cycle response regulator
LAARILLIEDNPANLELMSYLLSAFGHAPLVAVDGAEGLEAVRRETPDLVVCDVQLPTMDGCEIARRIKSTPVLCSIPLVAVTALAMVGDREKVMAAGFDGYIAKPINPETFVREIEVFLRPEQRTTAPAGWATTPAPRAKPSNGLTILVVDDTPANLALAPDILEPHGYQVLTADTMAEGLMLARKRHCDLILSDVCMAAGNGYDFIRAVKADARLCSIPFVFLTSTMLTEKDRAHGIGLGATRFLTRPIEPEVLLAEIEACLSKQEDET